MQPRRNLSYDIPQLLLQNLERCVLWVPVTSDHDHLPNYKPCSISNEAHSTTTYVCIIHSHDIQNQKSVILSSKERGTRNTLPGSWMSLYFIICAQSV